MWCSLHLRRLLILLTLKAIQAKDPELPLCPTNMQYFPQNLPMHCRMPGTIPPFLPQIYQNSMLGKQPDAIPNPLPGLPGHLPGSIAGPIPGPMPGPLPMPMMPMPQPPAHKLPVIVMPFYSPEPSAKKPHSAYPIRPPRKRKPPHKKRRPKHYNSEDDSDTDTSTDDSTDASSERGWWRGSKQSRRSNHHHKLRKKYENKEILTPILQYVTKDGYVIFEKQISKGEAKDWLVTKYEDKSKLDSTTTRNEVEFDSNERRKEKTDRKLLIKDVEEVEVRSEKNPHQMTKKRNLKRKSVRQRVED